MKNFEIYAHRGASGRYLENTWSSFFEAKRLQVGIEMDVQITADGVVIVFHDDNLKRLTGKNAFIAEMPYSSIKELKIGKPGRRKFNKCRIPLAYEVFHWAKKYRIPLNVEMKSSFAHHPKGITTLAAMLDGLEDLHVSSFDPQLLKSMKKALPHVEMALILQKKSTLDTVKHMNWVDSVHCHKRYFSSGLLETLKAMRKPLRLYGIFGYEPLIRRNESQLEGIITDYPGCVKKKMNSLR